MKGNGTEELSSITKISPTSGDKKTDTTSSTNTYGLSWSEMVLFTGTYGDLGKLCKPTMRSTEQWLNIWKDNQDEKSFAVDTAYCGGV